MRYCVNGIKAFFVIAIVIAISYKSSAYNQYESEGWNVIKSDNNHLILSYKPVVSGFDTIITEDGIATIHPLIKGTYSRGNAGEPITLVSTVNITIPSREGFELADYRIVSNRTVDAMITPNPQYKTNDQSYSLMYNIDKNKYLNVADNEPVQLEYSGLARNRYLAKLTATAANYINGKIVIPHEIIVSINFETNSKLHSSRNPDEYDIPISINHFETKNWLIRQNKFSEDKSPKDKIQKIEGQVWIKIRVGKEGLYKITPSMLADLGYVISKDEVATIKVFSKGGIELSEYVPDAVKNEMNEQEIIVKTNTSGELEKILFYGSPAFGFNYNNNQGFKHYINHYGESNYYILTWKGSDGLRAVPRKSPDGKILHRPTTYTNLLFYEEELHNAFIAGSGRTWFGRNLLPATFTEQLSNLDRTGTVYYRVSFAHRSTDAGYFTVKENNREIINKSLNSVSGYYDAYRARVYDSLPASEIAGDNRSNLQFDYKNNSGGSSALGFFDWYEIHYPAYLLPVDNEIGFFSDPSSTGLAEYSINNFSGQEIYGFNVTDPANPIMIENNSNTGGMYVFNTELEIKNPKRYFISSNIKTPSIERAEFADLRNIHADADLIVITNRKLLESAEKYKEYREQQSNLKTVVVRTDQIFNEFASGIADPTAIRDFIAYAFNNWEKQPKYILFWGDGHYDYKNISTKSVNFVPTYQTEDDFDSFYEINSYTTDDYFANVAGNDNLIDIAIGRLPIYSNESGNRMLDKINHYENNSSIDSWRTKMTIVADDSWKSHGYDQALHTGQAESLWSDVLPDYVQINKIYLPEYPTESVTGGKRKPRAMEAIISTVNTGGNLLLSFIGHGNPRVWTHEEVFERSITIPQMKNLDKLFFLTAASCDFGRFDATEVRSGAEELLLSQVGGAIGTFSSTRLVFAGQNKTLQEYLYSKIFERNPENGEYYNIGDVSYFTKAEKDSENDLKYCLLADPTVKLLIPDYQTFIDTINNVYIGGNDTAFIEALSKVQIKGRISNPSSSITDETFNGTVIITMLDCDKYVEVFEEDGSHNGTTHRYYKNGGALNRSSYKVVNGRFTAEFYIPKDISFSGDPGRLYAYAYTEDNRYANGDTRNFIISGITGVDDRDSTGPEISVYLDSREFISSDYVQCVPLLIIDLNDESGINTTGLGLGHRIEAWIDDNPNSIDLTEKFRTSIDNSGSGTVEELIFSLDPGVHTVKVRAWDVFNNYSTAESFFRTSDCDGIVISNLLNYPNPVSSLTRIRFNHNISPPFSLELKIMNILGQGVYRTNMQINTSHVAEIEWNCMDNNGAMVPSGNYLYMLNFETLEGIRTTEKSIMTLIR
ncbi:type IX secretion system sortase PorU [Bacteroidota bacterium]